MPKTSKKSERSCTETTPPLKEKSLWSTEKKTSVVTVGLIAIIAFIMRAAFSFGTLMNSPSTLSGGLKASGHLHTIVQILEGNNAFGSINPLHYPYDSIEGNPTVIDFIIASIASVMGTGTSPIVVASFALGTFSILCGTITVIIAYILGLEVIGTKKGGYLTAIFMAFCPVAISQTVFSNGTEIGWHLLLITTFFTLFIKGIKSFNAFSKEDKLSNVVKNNHRSMKFGLISGAILALITISTSDFRPIFVILIFVMVIVALVDRIRNIDSRLPILYFSIVILIGMIVATTYYIPAGSWDTILSGIFTATIFGVVMCIVFSMLQNRPWITTIPAFIIITLAFFIGLAFIMPNLFDSVVYGNTGYASEVSKLVADGISISKMSTFFGPVTLWFGSITIISMLMRIRKNIGSHKYIAVLMIMIFGTHYGWKSQDYATMFSFVFAIGFAYVVIWLFKSIDFKSYFTSFKTANFKTFWKKLIRPVPFISILSIISLIIAPNMVYAAEASMSVNQNDDPYRADLNFVEYNTKSGINKALSSYQHSDKSGAMVCWSNNSKDASTFGGFNVITDSKWGAVAVSNILLSNGTDGSSTAAMLIYTLKHTGFNDDIKEKLKKAGLEEEDYIKLEKIVNCPHEFRSFVIDNDNADKFGTISTSVSDENISYLYGKWFLSKKYDGFTISKMYDALADRCKISYFMIDGSLFPIYHGRSSAFNDMAISNGYDPTKNFINVDYFTMLSGIYSYGDKMYNTFLWRAYIGMSPKEVQITTGTSVLPSNYLINLMLSDGKYKAQPGYGLSNYVVDLDHWFVMYNPDKNATVSSDGWTQMLYTEAIAKQKEKGGLINYLSGLPVFLKYIPNSDGNTISGSVNCDNYAVKGVKGVRVSAIDSDGIIRSTTYTNDNGKFNLNVIDPNSIINFYSGSSNLSDGTLIKTAMVGDDYNVNIPQTSINGKCVSKNGDDLSIQNMKIVIEGKTTGAKGEYTGLSNNISIGGLVPDVYDVKITSRDGKSLYTKEAATITVVPGINNNVEFKIKETYKVTLTFKDEFGSKLSSGEKVSLFDMVLGNTHTSEINDEGTAVYNVPSGSYKVRFIGDYASHYIHVDTDISKTMAAIPLTTVNFNNLPPDKRVTVHGPLEWCYEQVTTDDKLGCQHESYAITDNKGSLSIKVPKGTGDKVIYSVYAHDEEKVYMARSDRPTESGAKVEIHGELRISSETVIGDILFINKDGISVPVMSWDGKYSVPLMKGEYTIYAYTHNKGKLFSAIESYTVDNPEEHIIKLESGAPVYGKISCQQTDREMCYMPLNVNFKDHNLSLTTDINGFYRVYLPGHGEKCKIKPLLSDAYVDCDGIEVINGADFRTGRTDFKVSLRDVHVYNNTGHTIKINDNVEIEDKAGKYIRRSSAPIKVGYTDSNHYYYEGYITPTTREVTIKEDTFNVKYYPLWIKNANDYDVNVDPINDGKKFVGPNDAYYLENDKKFRVTAIKSDFKKVLYKNISKTETIDVEQMSKPMITLTGFVGFAGSGKITVTIDNEKFDFGVDASGRYKIFVPKCDLKLSVLIEDKDNNGNVKSSYVRSVDIKCSDLEDEKVYNLAVIGGNNVTGDTKIESHISKMSINEDVAEIIFSSHLSKCNKNKTTYTISGGPGWRYISFYSDQAMTNQISSLNIDDGITIYGKGTIVGSKVGLGSDDLSIILKDLSGKVCGTGVFDDYDIKWHKTDHKSTEVYAGVNSAGDSEYMCAIKIVNKDNYAKKFKIDHKPIEGDWHETYLCNEKITSKSDEISVPGYATEVINLKLTSKYGQSKLPESVEFTITPVDTSETIKGGPGVTISNNIAMFNSKIIPAAIEVTDSSADGRKVVNNMRSMPIAVWVLTVVIIILLFITIWEAFRRGVFTRKK